MKKKILSLIMITGRKNKMKKSMCLIGLLVIIYGCSNLHVFSPSISMGEDYQNDIEGSIIEGITEINTEITNEDTSYDLDKKFNEDISKANGATSEMVRVLLEYSTLWKKEMDQYYGMLLEKLDEDGKAGLISSQDAWDTYIEQNNQLVLHCNSLLYDGGGTYPVTLEAELKYKKYRERALELMDLYDILEQYFTLEDSDL